MCSWPLITARMLKFRLSIFVVFLFHAQISWAQCSMCKAVAESSQQGGSAIAEGLNDGILYLMAFPYIILFSLGILWYRHKKQVKAST